MPALATLPAVVTRPTAVGLPLPLPTVQEPALPAAVDEVAEASPVGADLSVPEDEQEEGVGRGAAAAELPSSTGYNHDSASGHIRSVAMPAESPCTNLHLFGTGRMGATGSSRSVPATC